MAHPVLNVDERVSLIKRAITANYTKGSEGAKPVIDAIEKVRQAGKDIEVAFKDVLVEQMSAALSKGVSLTDERHVHLRQLMDLALSVCIEGEVAPKAPAMLLEDFFEVLPLDDVNTMWAEVEAREAKIYKLFETYELNRIREAAKKGEGQGGDNLDASGNPEMPAAKGAKKAEVPPKAPAMTANNTVRLCMLKTCNALLRKLSKVQNTKVCGRVMLYLARNWALSDTSALNKLGTANVNNKTNFETVDEFKANHSSQRTGGDAMETDAEGSRRRNLDEEAEAEMQRILNLSSELHVKTEEGAERAPEPEPLEFQLYQTFWGLQGYLSAPKAFLDAKTPERWAEFVSGAKTVLEAFDGMVVSEEAAQQMLEEKRKAPSSFTGSSSATSGAKRRRTTLGGAGAGVRRASSGGSSQGVEKEDDDAYVGCKYLTNSRLFRLQLRDPLIRVQVLTQMATVLQYIDLHSRSNGQELPSGHPELSRHVRRLIQSTPPLGAHYLALLDSTLEREEWWVNWKARSCAGEVEKEGASRAPRVYKQDARYTEALKRFQETQCFKGATASLRGFWSESAPLPAPLELGQVEALLQCTSHSWEHDVDRVVQESERGIEEYGPSYDEEGYLEHPCRNPVFNWRALRLAKRTHPQAFATLDTGDLNMLWKKVHGKPTMFTNTKMRPEAAPMEEEEEGEAGQPVGEGGEGQTPAPGAMDVDEGWGEEGPPKGTDIKTEA